MRLRALNMLYCNFKERSTGVQDCQVSYCAEPTEAARVLRVSHGCDGMRVLVKGCALLCCPVLKIAARANMRGPARKLFCNSWLGSCCQLRSLLRCATPSRKSSSGDVHCQSCIDPCPLTGCCQPLQFCADFAAAPAALYSSKVRGPAVLLQCPLKGRRPPPGRCGH